MAKTRIHTFISGPEQAALPTAGTPTDPSDVATKAYVDANTGVTIKEEGVDVGDNIVNIDFVGAIVTASLDDPTSVSVSLASPVIAIKEEGVAVSSTVNSLDFVGASVTASGGPGEITVTVSDPTITVQEEGVNIATDIKTLNFAGSNVTAATDGANKVTVTVANTAIEVLDEGSSLGTGFNQLDFVGSGVIATLATATKATITIAGGGGGGGGGTMVTWHNDSGDSPVQTTLYGNKVWAFEDGAAQNLYCTVKVPQGYVAGSPIKMRVNHFHEAASATQLLLAQATLIEPGDAFDDVTDQRTTTNSAVTAASKVITEAVLDITSASGEINSVAVAGGDLIKVRLYRGTDTSASDVYFIESCSEVTFS